MSRRTLAPAKPAALRSAAGNKLPIAGRRRAHVVASLRDAKPGLGETGPRACCAGWLLVALFAGSVRAEEPLQYRWMFIPEDEITKLGEVYLPVKRSAFDQLLSTIRARQAAPGRGARLAEAAYTARLDRHELVEGQANLSIVHSGKTPALLPLDPCGLVIGEATWASAPSPATPSPPNPGAKTDGPSQPVGDTTTVPGAPDAKLGQEAKLGLNDRGQWVAYVETSGTLQFPWSLKGGRGPLGEVRLELRLPACPVNHLVLEIPTGFKPVTEQGVTYPIPERPARNDFQSWGIDLGGTCFTVLHVIPEQLDWQSQRLVLVREFSTYRFSPQGAEVQVELHFDVYHQPLRYVTLSLDTSLELVQAEQGDSRLRWSQSAGPDEDRRQLVLELAEPLAGEDQVLRLRAVAPALLGTPWQLPTLSVTDAIWQAGRVTLEVPRPLVLEQLNTENCRQESVSPLPSPASGEVVQIQCFQSQPGILACLRSQEGGVTAQTGTTIRLGSSASTAQLVADFTSAGVQCFRLELDVAAHWNIDAVEAEPASMLEDWSLAQRATRSQRLLLRLREPLRPERPLHLVIHASGRGVSTDGPTSSELLRLGTWANVDVVRALVSLGAEPPHQIRFAGDAELVRLDPTKLSAAEAGLVSSVPGGVVFVDRLENIPWTVALSSEAPNYSAEINIETVVEDKTVQQSVRIRCLPRASSLSRLLVHFSESSEDSLRWTSAAEPTLTVDARPLTVDARRLLPQEDTFSGGETWQIVLPRPQDMPFELRAERVSKFGAKLGEMFTVPLATLPDAATQLGWVTVRTPLALSVGIDEERVWPVPAESPPPDQSATTRGVFRYDSFQVGRIAVVRKASDELPPTVWAWSCQMISRAAREGRAVHTVVYQLENTGAVQLALTRPVLAKGWRVTVDGRELTGPDDGGERLPVPIPLPRGVRFPSLRVEYTTEDQPLAAFGTVSAYWPQVDISVLGRSWIVWLPPEFDRLPASGNAASPTWTERLFAPLVRTTSQTPCNPLAPNAWQRFGAPSELPAVAGLTGADPWFRETKRANAELAETGWAAHAVPVPWPAVGAPPVEAELQLRVYRPGVVQALGWVAFLMALGLAWSLTRRRVLLAIPLTAAAGLVALTCPGYLVPVGSGGFLGTLLAMWLVVFRRQEPDAVGGKVSTTPSKFGAAAFTNLSLWLAVGCGGLSAGTGWAVQPTAEPAPPSSSTTIHRVYVPVGEGNQPVGDYVFVPRSCYDALQREASAGEANLLKWLIRNAEYRVVFHGGETDEKLAATELVARYELDIFQPDAKILLPIAAEQVQLLPNRARLDGQPAVVAWMADGTGLSVAAQGSGKVVLELAFCPHLDDRESSAGFDIRIPRVARSLVRFELSAAMPKVQVPSALGGMELDERTGELLAKLGPTERLSVQWSPDTDLEPSVSELEVDQLMWLKIEPGAVVLDTRLTFRSSGKPLQQVRLQVDPQLRLLPPKADQPIAAYYVSPREPATLILELKPPYRKACSLEVSFLVMDATGPGKLTPPRLQPAADRVQRRWLAVSVAPSLQCDLSEELLGYERERGDFAAAWDPLPMPPQFLLDLPPEQTTGSLTTSLKIPQIKATPQLDVAIGSESANLLWHVDINLTAGILFQHRLLVPKEVAVRSVAVVEQGAARAAHWSRDEKGVVTVLLDGPLAESHQLQLAGQLPLPKTRQLKLPRLTVADGEVSAEQVQIYRHPEVQVNLTKQTGYTAVRDAQLGQYRQGWGRLVAALETSPKPDLSASLQLTVAPNRPRVQARLVILLSRPEEAWRAVADYDLQIEGGVLDVLRLDIPEEWTAPFELEPAAECECVAWPGQPRQFLVIRPPQAVSERYRIRVRGAISTAPGERVRAPDILPLDVDHAQRYLVAPTRIKQRQIAWETSGLVPASLPTDYVSPPLPSYISYRAPKPRFQATIKDVKVESGSARVRFADLRVDCGPEGGWRGVATFDLEPAGLTACELELPPNQHLVQVTVAGLPTLVDGLGERRWRVSLSHRQLPQTLQVIFTGHLDATHKHPIHGALEAPQIRDVPVQRTLWTVRGPWAVRFPDLPGEDLPDGWTQDIHRLTNMVELMESAASLFAESMPQDVTRWYLPWATRWAAVRGRLEQWRDSAGAISTYDPNLLADLERRQESLAAKLQAACPPSAPKPATPSVPSVPSVPDLAAFPVATSEPDSRTYCRAFSGFAETIELEPPMTTARHIKDRLVGVGVLFGLALVGCLLLPQPALALGLARRAPLVGLLLGWAWWWWAVPSLLGLLVSAASVLIWIASWLPLRRLPAGVAVKKS
ncbi:MAG: hypothetical protein NTY19_52295 [Planctomycetota bacterium]|nr:hypothetical protein [Planctomycetota bacterium]